MADNFTAVQVDSAGVMRRLEALRHAAGDTTPALAAIGQNWHSKVLLAFKSGASPYGVPWQPIKHRDGQPLRDTGILNRSFSVRAVDNQLQLGTNVEYARLHQFGYNGPVTVPAHVRRITQAFGKPIEPKSVSVKAHTRQMRVAARPFLPGAGLPDSWKNSALRILAQHITKAVGQGGGK